MPKISIIIPVYNTENYLKKCLNSLINQTFNDIEIICIDDGSTDSSLLILKEFALKDPRIQILTQENSKQGAARNRGIEIAKGEFITWPDVAKYLKDVDDVVILDKKGENNEKTLTLTNHKGNNDIQLQKIIDYYPQIKQILKK